MLTIREIYDFIDRTAPFENQESFDNSGLLLGSMEQEVTGVHVALDCTMGVIAEAESLGANLILTHHPLMFHARKRLTEDDHEARLLCRMIRGRMAFIAAHTNFDRAPGGTGDVLAQLCGIVTPEVNDYLRAGELIRPLTARDLADQLTEKLNTVIRLMGDPDKLIRRLAVCSGSGGDLWAQAHAMGADAFLSGEIGHHDGALECAACGMVALDAGHHATEAPGIFALADALQNYLNAVQYRVTVSKSLIPAYRG